MVLYMVVGFNIAVILIQLPVLIYFLRMNHKLDKERHDAINHLRGLANQPNPAQFRDISKRE